MVRIKSIKCWLFLWLCLGFSNFTMAADINVTMDRDTVSLQDSFSLLFQVIGKVDGDPDFSPLEKDFTIVSREQRSNLSIINGTRSKRKEWLLELRAKREGNIVIPPVSFGSDQSPAKAVSVKATPVNNGQKNQGKEIFIEVEVSKRESWVQAQIIYTVQLFRSVNTFNSSLSEVKLKGAPVIAEKLEDRQFEISRDGKRYVVLQRRFAIFPQASGHLTLEPIIFTGQISQQSRHLFDPFGRNSRTIQRQSEPIELNIKPIPADYKGKTWLPAKKIELSEKWMKNELELVAGEPVTRTIVIKAEGLTSKQLPDIKLSELDDFKVYPDKPETHNRIDRDGVTAIRQEKSAVIPHKAGEYVLPAVELTWWNTQTETMEVAHLPERQIKVTGSISEPAKTTQKGKQAEVDDLAEISSPKNSIQSQEPAADFWPWIALFFAIAWLFTSFLLWKVWQQQKTKSAADTTESITMVSERSARRSVRAAMQTQDPDQIKDAVLVWGKSLWPENIPNNLAELGQRCGQPISGELQKLNQSLYAANKNDISKTWQSDTLLVAIENFDLKKVTQSEMNHSNLLPLNNI